MISDSTYWKKTLSAHAELLNTKMQQRHWRDESYLKVEQAVMMSCYIVRKLAEAKKITAASYQRPIDLQTFSATGMTVDALNNHRLDELYDINAGIGTMKPFSYVANQLIHSYTFVPVFIEKNMLHGITFNSDKSKSKELYMVKLRTLIEVFAECANSALSSITYFRLENGELTVVPGDAA